MIGSRAGKVWRPVVELGVTSLVSAANPCQSESDGAGPSEPYGEGSFAVPYLPGENGDEEGA